MTIAACLALAGAGQAQVSDLTVGYCNGELPSKGDISFSEPDAYVSAAIYIPAGTVNTYAGNVFTGVNAGLASKLNIDELTVWLRNEIDGENLVEATIGTSGDQKIVKGWNAVMFENAYNITEGNTTGLYIGYTYHQKGSCFGVAAIDTPTPNAFFLKQGSGEWQDRSAEGALSLEGFVQGESLPKVNLTLVSVDVPEVLILEKNSVEVTGVVKNIATNDITDFDVNLLVDGEIKSTEHVSGTLAYNKLATFTVELEHNLTEVLSGENELTILVNNVNGADDEDMTDNAISKPFSMVQHDYTHKIFVEEFTTEQCPNCPRVANYIHEALAKDEFAENVLVVCHHSGFYTDWLTARFDEAYLWLFGAGSYAPAMMIDRTIVTGEASPFLPQSLASMEAHWRNRLAVPAFVSLNIEAGYDEEESGKMNVKVTGTRSKSDLCENPVITVYLVEDNIAARSQAGAGPEGFTHNHVNRAVNATWGVPVEWNGDDYSYECQFTIAPSWNPENFSVVALISNYDSERYVNCEVLNANNLEASKITGDAGVAGIVDDMYTEEEIFTLSGVKVSGTELAPGVYVRKAGSWTEKFIVK